MPELAESVVEGEILKWLVKEGDVVVTDQPIVEVMTDKVTVELPTPFAGRIDKIVTPEGAVVEVGKPMALISSADEKAVESGPPTQPALNQLAPAQPTPNQGANTAAQTTGVGVQAVPGGPAVVASQSVATLDVQPQGESATPESPAGEDRLEERSIVESGFGLPVKTAKIEFDRPAARTAGPSQPTAQAQAALNRFGRVLAVPAARKLATDNGLDIATVPGSGPNGRVGIADVKAKLGGQAAEASSVPAGQPAPTVPAGQPAPTAPATPSTGNGLPVQPVQYRTPKGFENREERKPLRGMRRAIANQMLASHLYTVRTLTVDEADLGRLVALRTRLKPVAAEKNVKLTYLPFIFKALVAALREFPIVNASIDEATQEIVYKNYVNLGMAVATEAGLMVPVIKDAGSKSVLELGAAVNDLGSRARDGKLAPDELSGSSFSVTNMGSVGALFSFPIINVPDAAILGVHTIQDRAVVRDGRVVARPMMYLSLSFDHRLVDGAVGARFLRRVIDLLEDPDRLMLEAI